MKTVYNRGEIMRRGWELVKKKGLTKSAAFKFAWQEAKFRMAILMKKAATIFTPNTKTTYNEAVKVVGQIIKSFTNKTLAI